MFQIALGHDLRRVGLLHTKYNTKKWNFECTYVLLFHTGINNVNK